MLLYVYYTGLLKRFRVYYHKVLYKYCILLLLNSDKTTCTLFAPDPVVYQINLDLKLNNTALPMVTYPKALGLTLDPKLTYSRHIHNISVHAHKPLQMIKSLTATGWGKQNETLMATYKVVMRPVLEYASSYGCCLPTPMTLASGGSPMFPLVVHQPASPSIWPAVQSLRRGLSTNPGVTM